MASLSVVVEEPRAEALPVRESAAPAALNLDVGPAESGKPGVGLVDPLQQPGQDRPEPEQAFLDLGCVESDVVGDCLGVVEQECSLKPENSSKSRS